MISDSANIEKKYYNETVMGGKKSRKVTSSGKPGTNRHLDASLDCHFEIKNSKVFCLFTVNT